MVQEREWTWQEAQGVGAGGCASRAVDITASTISFDIVKFKIIKTLLYSAPLKVRRTFLIPIHSSHALTQSSHNSFSERP